MAVDWFPEIEVSPPVIPALPGNLSPGFVTNPYIAGGDRVLTWANAETISELNAGGTILEGTLFTIREDDREEPFGNVIKDFPEITEEFRQSLLAGYGPIGLHDLQTGSRELGAWTLSWFSCRPSSDPERGDWRVAWLYRADEPSYVLIDMIAGDESLWKNFTEGTGVSEAPATSGH